MLELGENTESCLLDEQVLYKDAEEFRRWTGANAPQGAQDLRVSGGLAAVDANLPARRRRKRGEL